MARPTLLAIRSSDIATTTRQLGIVPIASSPSNKVAWSAYPVPYISRMGCAARTRTKAPSDVITTHLARTPRVSSASR